MWNCPACGCSAIAGTLTFCPMCFKEREMPKTTTGGGYSNQYEPAAPADDQEPAEAVPYAEDNAEHDPDRGNGPDQPELPFEDEAPEAQGAESDEEQPDYSAYAVRDLVDLCKERGVAYSGPSGTLSKADLVARLVTQDVVSGG